MKISIFTNTKNR